MKKLLSTTFVLLLFVSFANATVLLDLGKKTDCHVYACQQLEQEESFMGELNETEADTVYGFYFNQCEDDQ